MASITSDLADAMPEPWMASTPSHTDDVGYHSHATRDGIAMLELANVGQKAGR